MNHGSITNSTTSASNATHTLTTEDITEMTDEEFLIWLFGDIDFDSLTVTVFD